MATFLNPNDPIQPQAGVYCWYAEKGSIKFAVYVGNAGEKPSYTPKGTLFRGVSELQRSTFSQEATIDTDFIVGTTIQYLERLGFSCHWRHVCDDPRCERQYVRDERPLLQKGNGHILEALRLRGEAGCWKLAKCSVADAMKRNGMMVAEAEQRICSQIDVLFKVMDTASSSS